MKAIKKVEVTPIDYNIGKIIDSAATSDDKTKNTYSMRVIDSKVSDINDDINDAINEVDNDLATKVNKTGDTLTGELDFQNTDSYYAIKKSRIVEDNEHKLTVGIGVNGSSVLENYDGDTLVGRLEVRPNGEIWNAKNNCKILELGDIAIFTGTTTVSTEYPDEFEVVTINYPSGFTKDNCIPIAIGISTLTSQIAYGDYISSGSTLAGIPGEYQLLLSSYNIRLRVMKNNDRTSVNYKIVLLKIS